MWEMWIKPQSGFEWHFTCVKSRFLASMRVKIILGPKRVSSIFWHELLNLPVSSLAGIHATKIKLNIYFLCTAFRIDARHDCVSPVTLQHSTSYSSVDTQTSFPERRKRGKKERVDSFERETSTLLLRIYCREWAFKTKGSQRSN